MAVKIREHSRLKNARLVSVGGVEFWDSPEYPDIKPAPDDKRHTVSRYDRVDRLANRFYGSPELWWVIAIVNGLDLAPNGLYEGQVLRIPSGQRVFARILRDPTQGIEGR